MELSYFSLLSPEPVYIPGIGGVRCPTLKDISKISYENYCHHIRNLLINPNEYYLGINAIGYEKYFANYPKEMVEDILSVKNQYESLPIEKQYLCSIFDVMIYDTPFLESILNTLSFFVTGILEYDEENNVIKIYDSNSINKGEMSLIGLIHSKNFNILIDVILQRLNMQNTNNNTGEEKVKNKSKVQEILNKFKKSPPPKTKLNDVKTSLPNIISSLASHSIGLNILNIWDMTVYQLYDQYNRSKIEDIYRIHARSVSVYGNSDQKFDDSFWLTPIKN